MTNVSSVGFSEGKAVADSWPRIILISFQICNGHDTNFTDECNLLLGKLLLLIHIVYSYCTLFVMDNK